MFRWQFALSRSPFSVNIQWVPRLSVPRAEFVIQLGVTFYVNSRRSLHIFDCIKLVRCLSFEIRRLRQFGAKQTIITSDVHQCVPSIFPYCSPVISPAHSRNSDIFFVDVFMLLVVFLL